MVIIPFPQFLMSIIKALSKYLFNSRHIKQNLFIINIINNIFFLITVIHGSALSDIDKLFEGKIRFWRFPTTSHKANVNSSNICACNPSVFIENCIETFFSDKIRYKRINGEYRWPLERRKTKAVYPCLEDLQIWHFR